MPRSPKRFPKKIPKFLKNLPKFKSFSGRLPPIKKLLNKKQLTPLELKQLKQQSKKHLKSSPVGKFPYQIILYRNVKVKNRKKPVKVRIPIRDFVPNKDYDIYTRHRPTKQNRLRASGIVAKIPYNLKGRQFETIEYQIGATFNPKFKSPKYARGNWIPTGRLAEAYKDEIEKLAKKEGVEAQAVMIPQQRYFNKKWKVYSDKILKGNEWVQDLYVHIAVKFSYPHKKWVGKQTIRLRLNKPKRLKDLNTLKESRLLDSLDIDLLGKYEKARVESLKINGFIPYAKGFVRAPKKRRRKNK